MTALNKMLTIHGKYKTSWNTIIIQGRKCKRAGFRYEMELLACKYNIEITETDQTSARSIYTKLQEDESPCPDITVYTDGSNMDGKTGYGATITGYYNNDIYESLRPGKPRYSRQKSKQSFLQAKTSLPSTQQKKS